MSYIKVKSKPPNSKHDIQAYFCVGMNELYFTYVFKGCREWSEVILNTKGEKWCHIDEEVTDLRWGDGKVWSYGFIRWACAIPMIKK